MSFFLSKFLWAFTAPGNFVMWLLLLASLAAFSKKPCWQKWSRRICLGIALFLVVIALFQVGDAAIIPLENKFAASFPAQVEGIILLGGDEKPRISEARGMPVMMDSARRYIGFVELARRYPQAKLLFSGGSGRLIQDSDMKDAEVARQALVAMGLPPDRLQIEGQSRNTWENANFSADILHPHLGQKWMLVTSAFHMPRAVNCFQKAGFDVVPYPVGFMTDGTYGLHFEFRLQDQLLYLTLAFHEYLGLVAYRFLGYSDRVWPS